MFNNKTIRKEVVRVINKKINDAEKLYATQAKLIEKEAQEKVEKLKQEFKDNVSTAKAQAFSDKCSLMRQFVSSIVGSYE